jgi:hypothetical protein
MEPSAFMKITLLKTYSTYRPGDVVDCDDDVAMRLVREGAAQAEEAVQVVETAAVVNDAESADMTPQRMVRQVRGK